MKVGRLERLLADKGLERILVWRLLGAAPSDPRSRSIVGEIQTWALAQRTLPESSLGKAIGYLLRPWRGLTRFLDDPRIPLDNNRTERGLRGVVLGRAADGGRSLSRNFEGNSLRTTCPSPKLRPAPRD